jgi:hypothetical protein
MDDNEILEALRVKLQPIDDDDIPISEIRERNNNLKTSLLVKLNNCRNTLPNPDAILVRQIELYAQFQLELLRDDSMQDILKAVLTTSTYNKSNKVQVGDNGGYPFQSTCAEHDDTHSSTDINYTALFLFFWIRVSLVCHDPLPAVRGFL